MSPIWLTSYPKSGNTWMRLLLSNLLGGGETPERINAMSLEQGIASSIMLFDQLTLCESGLMSAREIELLRARFNDTLDASSGKAVIKVHDAYHLPGGAPFLTRAGSRALHLVRDPRDVAVSLSHHMDLSLDDTIRFMSAPDSAFGGHQHGPQFKQHLGSWSTHATGWLDQTRVSVTLVRYEDLLQDTLSVFRLIVTSLALEADEGALARAVRHADFSELQRQETAEDFRERKGSSPFFRSGRSGDWRHHLDAAQVRRLECDHGAVMDRLGYIREETSSCG